MNEKRAAVRLSFLIGLRAAEGVGPYVCLAEFARMRKGIRIRFFGDMCGEKSP